MGNAQVPRRLEVIDSHTLGEPTRCVISGGPDLGSGPLSDQLEHLRRDYDHYRRAVLCEPRGSDVLVGAYLLEPFNPANAAAVIFFNNAGYLGMCGHGMIGLAVTLAHLGRIQPGEHAIETPVGTVRIQLHEGNRVTIRNVPAYRHRAGVTVHMPGYGTVTGDPANSGRNFVLCPGKAYDRSPCGTGTSAKMACLAADGHLNPGETWRQEGILGTVFEGSYAIGEPGTDRIIPAVTGSAYVTAECTLIFDPDDPFRLGVPE
jgi:proline racemase